MYKVCKLCFDKQRNTHHQILLLSFEFCIMFLFYIVCLQDYKFPKSGGVSGNPLLLLGPGLSKWTTCQDRGLPSHPLSCILPSPCTPQGQVQQWLTKKRKGESQQPESALKRCRDDNKELLDLIKEDLTFQREVEERRVQERMDRLFLIMEKIANKLVFIFQFCLKYIKFM